MITRWLAFALTAVMAVLAAYSYGHRKGAELAELHHAAQRTTDIAAALDRATAIAAHLRALGQHLQQAMATSHERERIVVKTVTEVIRENPDFAAVRRPPELDRVRQAQLQAIADATTADMPR